MRIAALARKGNIGRERHVAGDFFPNKMKRIVGEPHIRSAARDGVSTARRIKLKCAPVLRRGDIAVFFEQTRGASLCGRDGAD